MFSLKTSKQRRKVRETLRKRDGDNCYHCNREMNFENPKGNKQPLNQATIEHLQPKSKGGLNVYCNLALACYTCNMWRGNRSLIRK